MTSVMFATSEASKSSVTSKLTQGAQCFELSSRGVAVLMVTYTCGEYYGHSKPPRHLWASASNHFICIHAHLML